MLMHLAPLSPSFLGDTDPIFLTWCVRSCTGDQLATKSLIVLGIGEIINSYLSSEEDIHIGDHF